MGLLVQNRPTGISGPRRIFRPHRRENLLIPTSSLAGHQVQTRGGAGRWNLEKVMTEFPRLAERIKQFGGTLSGGEQQMLAIGRALMANPDII
jgi:ABC-type branched-subunit amino acid transport system ATPase component